MTYITLTFNGIAKSVSASTVTEELYSLSLEKKADKARLDEITGAINYRLFEIEHRSDQYNPQYLVAREADERSELDCLKRKIQKLLEEQRSQPAEAAPS